MNYPWISIADKIMKSHLIYKITNLINNKIYIGYHSTNDIHDNYFGSGVALNKAIKKYGKKLTKDGISKMSKPGSEKWNDLILEGYTSYGD